MTNEHTAICFDLIDSTTWGVAHYTTIDSSRIHGCGELPSTNQDHGIYISGYYATVTNNYIYDNADRGVQLRGSQNGTIQHNVIDRNGEGVIFGDQVTSNNDVSNNIVSNSNIRWNADVLLGRRPGRHRQLLPQQLRLGLEQRVVLRQPGRRGRRERLLRVGEHDREPLVPWTQAPGTMRSRAGARARAWGR